MKIDCYLSWHRGSYHELNGRISASLKELGLTADVESHRVYNSDDAAALGVPGSPTIRINGRDIGSGGSPEIT